MSARERFERKVIREHGGCWIWQGTLNEKGYGQFRSEEGKTRRAHKWAYEDRNGPVPVGLELDHTCRNRACVNPDHLEAVTHQENLRRRTRNELPHGYSRYVHGGCKCEVCRGAQAEYSRQRRAKAQYDAIMGGAQ